MYQKSLIALALVAASASAFAAADDALFSGNGAASAPALFTTVEQCATKYKAVEAAFANPGGYVADGFQRGRFNIDPLSEHFSAQSAQQCIEQLRNRSLTADEKAAVALSAKGPDWLLRLPMLGAVLEFSKQVTASGQCVKVSDYDTQLQCRGAKGCKADYRNPTVQVALGTLDDRYSKSTFVLFGKSDFCPDDAQRVMTGVVKRMVEFQQGQATPLLPLLKP